MKALTKWAMERFLLFFYAHCAQTTTDAFNDNTLSKVRQALEKEANGEELFNNFVNSSINDGSSLGLKPGKRKRIATFHAAVACFQTQSTSCHI